MTNSKITSPQELKLFSPECYFHCPESGAPAWSIQFPAVPAVKKSEAARIISAMPHFDCFIEEGFLKFNKSN